VPGGMASLAGWAFRFLGGAVGCCMVVAAAFSACVFASTVSCNVSKLLTVVTLCEPQLGCVSLGSIGSPLDVGALFDTGVCCIWVVCEDRDRLVDWLGFRVGAGSVGFFSKRCNA